MGILSRKKNVNITEGPLFSSMIVFAIPLFLANLISTFFGAMDLMVLSRFAEGNEVAAVGSTSAITALFLNATHGLGGGITVILSRCFGEKNKERAQRVISTAILTAVFLGTLFAVIGALLIPSFLRWTNCPSDCAADATLYAVIYILGMPFYLLYGYLANTLRVSGDSEQPLYYMLAAGVTNIVLNFLLCVVLPHKVLAVAVATLASNALGAFLCLRRLAKNEGIAHWEIKKTCFDFDAFVSILRNGLPIALASALFPIANMQIQSGINAHGSSAVAGNTACTQYEAFIYSVYAAFNTTTMTFMGQNIGAKKPKRAFRSFFYMQSLTMVVTLALSLIVFAFGEHLLPLFIGDDPVAVAAGMVRVRWVVLFFAVSYNVFSTAINIFGYPALQTTVEAIGIFGLRTIWLQFVYGKVVERSLEMLYLCIPLSNVFTALVNGGIAAVLLLRYRKGKYKEKI